MAYTDLITQSELTTDAQNSLSADDATAIANAITDVTRQIEGFLGRKLICRKVQHPVTEDEWTTDDVTDDKSWIWADEWPVVEMITADLESHAYSDMKLQIATTDEDTELYEYFAGYRRSDQTLADLQGESELSSLTTLPDVLPADIRRAAVELTLYKLHQARDGTYGRGSVTQEVGTQTVTVERADTKFEERTLWKIGEYRKYTL